MSLNYVSHLSRDGARVFACSRVRVFSCLFFLFYLHREIPADPLHTICAQLNQLSAFQLYVGGFQPIPRPKAKKEWQKKPRRILEGGWAREEIKDKRKERKENGILYIFDMHALVHLFLDPSMYQGTYIIKSLKTHF